MEKKSDLQLTKNNRLSDFLGKEFSWLSILALAILVWLVYIFFSGQMTQFYASALFGFYAITKHMWVSVMLLGVFQTIIMIPLRIFRVRSSNNIKEFQETIEAQGDMVALRKQLRNDFHLGNKTFLFYVVDFMIQLLTFMTIGRLFLTDFYTKMLNPNLLYSFIPYPAYPIKSTFFKIPYLAVTDTHRFGWKIVLIVWLVLIFVQLMLGTFASIKNHENKDSSKSFSTPLAGKYGFGYVVISLILAFVLMRHFPVAFALKIFRGDVSVPNQTLNTVTAVVTFLMIMWFGYRHIIHKTQLALASNLTQDVIFETRKSMIKETVQTATLVGLGAYLITNQIPSAFELSIFTFEMIALFSPVTLDKLILKTAKKPAANASLINES